MDDLFGNAGAVAVDWPADYQMQFWNKWPAHARKHSRVQVFDKLARIRRDGGLKLKHSFLPATWDEIWGGLCSYVASNPEHKFIPCPLVWVNQGRWIASHDAAPAPRPTFGDIMRGGAARHG